MSRGEEIWEFLSLYIASPLGMAINTLGLLALCVWLGLTYFRRLPLLTGKHTALGKIVYADYNEPLSGGYGESNVQFCFKVNGIAHNGKIPARQMSYELLRTKYKVGAEVTVYYSPGMPRGAYVDTIPSYRIFLWDTVYFNFIAPLLMLNILGIGWQLFTLIPQWLQF